MEKVEEEGVGVEEVEGVVLEVEEEGHGLAHQDLHHQGQDHGSVPQDPLLLLGLLEVQQQGYLELHGAEVEALQATINLITVFHIGKEQGSTIQLITG